MTLIQDILCKEAEWAKNDCNLDNMLFYYSTPTEFVEVLKETAKKDKFAPYPFVFVNSQTVSYDRTNKNLTTISVGELVIATITKPNYKSAERDLKTFKPILLPYMDAFLDRVTNGQGLVLQSYGTTKLHYFYGKEGIYGSEGNLFNDSVDAIQILDLEFRLTKNNNCKK